MHGILMRNPPTVTMSLKAVESHKLFLEAMKSKDVELGRGIMLEHLQEVHMYIKAMASS
jgi:DNA-binding GntR family transcriptional regulator